MLGVKHDRDSRGGKVAEAEESFRFFRGPEQLEHLGERKEVFGRYYAARKAWFEAMCSYQPVMDEMIKDLVGFTESTPTFKPEFGLINLYLSKITREN
jgi:hypothetical protein